MSMAAKSKNRLSFAKSSKYKGSPKTPSVISNDEGCPSPLRSNYSMNSSSCSTPITSRNRAYFLEESPSQDYDMMSQQSSIPLSQECSKRDVIWQWNSPKSIYNEPHKSSDPKLKLNKRIFLQPKEHTCKKNILNNKTAVKQETGFLKFQKEFQDLQSMSKINNDADIDILYNEDTEDKDSERVTNISSEKENDFDSLKNLYIPSKINANKALNNINKDSHHVSTKNNTPNSHDIKTHGVPKKDNIIELLDDSDFDNIVATQNFDLLIENSNKIIHNSQKESYNLVNNEPDDSIDDALSHFPLEDVVLKHYTANVAKKTSGNSSGYSTNRNSFSRHNSMPQTSSNGHQDCISYQIGYNAGFQNKNSFKRNVSSDNLTNCDSSSSTSSTLSTHSSVGRCTNEQIEKKRKEALQRLLSKRNRMK